jgi:hypothetical protein
MNFSKTVTVPTVMNQNSANDTHGFSVWIALGAGLFIVALTLSAIVDPRLRALHPLQAMIYVAVILLTYRKMPEGFGAAVTIAVAWNSLGLFITHLIQVGLRLWWSLLTTGQVRRLDTMMVALGGVAHFILIVACAAGFLKLQPRKREWIRFAAGAVGVLVYFALIVIIAAPR